MPPRFFVPTVGYLSALSYLRFSGSLFSGTLPTQLALLSQLQFLQGLRNPLGGTLSESFFQAWTAMTHLDLSYMQLSGTIPPTVAFMSSINYLSLSNNSFTGPVPSSLGGLAASGVLTSLALDGNAFAGTLDPRLLSLLGLCTGASAPSSFGSPGLAYTCPGTPSPSSPSSSSSPSTSSFVVGGAVGGALGGSLLLALLLFSIQYFRKRETVRDFPPSVSSCPADAPFDLDAASRGKVSYTSSKEFTGASDARQVSNQPASRGLASTDWRASGSASGTATLPSRDSTFTSGTATLPSRDTAVLTSAEVALGTWQCDLHSCASHDVYMWCGPLVSRPFLDRICFSFELR